MEARSLTQKDLWRIFGSKGITSEVFHGKRSISKTQAKKLAEFFHPRRSCSSRQLGKGSVRRHKNVL